MNVTMNRLDPNVPDPVESRRHAAGRFVRIVYAAGVFGVLGFFVIYFGAPLVFLSGPGTVSAPVHLVSLPYLVQVRAVNVTYGAAVKEGDEIGQVWSPEQDNIVATFMRGLADIESRRSQLRVEARVAQETLGAAKAYKELTEAAADQIEASQAASLTFRLEMHRERAAASKAVISQEAMVAEAVTQLADLDEFARRLRDHLDEVERDFADGRVLAPVDGIVSKNLAKVGQSLEASAPLAEILDPTDIYVDWHIPNARLVEPAVGNEVLVLFGHRRIPGRIVELLPVSDVYAAKQQLFASERPARLRAFASLPRLNRRH
jgi:multidrug resistance efflux pump